MVHLNQHIVKKYHKIIKLLSWNTQDYYRIKIGKRFYETTYISVSILSTIVNGLI